MKRLALAALAGLLLAALGVPAGGYTRMKASGTGVPLKWTSLPMKFNIHTSPAPGVSTSATRAAIRAAYKTWSSVSCSYYSSKDMGVVNKPNGDKSDTVNTNFYPSSWPAGYSSKALAVTKTYYDPNSGKILDADIMYNPSYAWSTTGASNKFDVQAVATHEVGHSLGLDHSASQSATMFYATGQGNLGPRSLHSDDINGVCAIYPTGTTPPPECTSPAQCAPSETCQNGTCVNVSQKGYGGPCSSGKDCKSGICLKYGSNTFCSQMCDSSPCPNGDKCLPLSGGGKACLPNSAGMNTKKLGEPCQTNLDCVSNICVSVPSKGYLCSQKCDVAKNNCPGGYYCASSSMGGLCIPGNKPKPPPPPPKKDLGQPCSFHSDCKSNLCASVGGGGLVCVQWCDPAKGNCPGGFTCKPIDSNKGLCVKGGTPPPPPPPQKKKFGEACTGHDDCESGICASDGAGKQFCTAVCDPAQGCPNQGYDCVAAGNKSVCAPAAGAPNPGDGGSSGCSLAPTPGSSAGVLLLLGLAAALLSRRRRR